jgi:lysozyme family protein
MDFAVNSGPARALRYVQTILGVSVTGKLDDATKAALADCDGAETASKLCDNRLEYLQKLPTFARYGKGWSARVDRVKAKSLEMGA